MGLDLPIGLIAGSVSLSGGHGTAIAWPDFVIIMTSSKHQKSV
jgi:sodium--glutamate symport carrier gltS